MAKDQWVEAALTNDSLVAELLLRMNHSSTSDSAKATTKSTTLSITLGWGHRKNRSKSTAPTTTAVSNGFGKEHRGSPTTHLSWSGGGGSTSDGYDESSRPSDLSSGSRSVKANEVASTSKSQKRKAFHEHKEEEQELASTRASLNQEKATSMNLKRIKIDFDQNPTGKMVRSESCRVIEEEETKRGFELPDLNMTPEEEDLTTTMS
ncbi:hypothetical protein L2E82_05977 [Cichorium intybus]|uniref:Uncharacterized protein n=1 Tax=Cichorium intybus TaxID=13427 RepID=A0ACB9H986_CICIN|nr:hypothetical protein L2E82_05977 [Cichorium intybus]